MAYLHGPREGRMFSEERAISCAVFTPLNVKKNLSWRQAHREAIELLSGR